MVTFITGAPCSGKTTLARQLADKTRDTVIVDFDALAMALGLCEKYTRVEDAITFTASKVREFAKQVILENTETIKNAIIIQCEIDEEEINKFREVTQVKHEHLDITKEEAIERAIADDRPQETLTAIDIYFGKNEKGKNVMKKKNIDIEIKAGEGEEHTVTFYGATFHREPDCVGDIIKKGAFADTLKKWKESGKPISLLFGHNMDDPLMNIGTIVSAEEDEIGLKCVASFDMENERGAYCYKLVKEGRLCKASFSYDIIEEAPVTLDNGVVANELRKLDLFEVSLVPVPANQHAEVIDVKGDAPKVKLSDDIIKEIAKAVHTAYIKGVKDEVNKDKFEDASTLGLLIDIETL